MGRRSALEIFNGDVIVHKSKEYTIKRISYTPGKIKIYTKCGEDFTFNRSKKFTVK